MFKNIEDRLIYRLNNGDIVGFIASIVNKIRYKSNSNSVIFMDLQRECNTGYLCFINTVLCVS